MNRKLVFLIGLLVGAAAIVAAWLSFQRAITPVQTQSSASSMRLESTAFAEGGAIPSTYSCDGKGINPGLKISGVPADAKSLALILHDPDAPGDFVHWTFWNADAAATDMKEGQAPVGAIQGHDGAGKAGYIGLCPPNGTHHYVFELFALDAKLDIPATTDAAGLRTAMQGHVLDSTRLTGTYARH